MDTVLFFWYRIVGAFFRLFPIKNNCIVFENFLGKGYGDNPKYIADEILRNYKTDFNIVWLIKGTKFSDMPEQIKQVKRGTLKELYYLSTAKVWIDNFRKHYGVKKRKGQFYIQTWHGGFPLKKIEKDALSVLSKTYIKSAINDSKMIDLLLISSKKIEKIFLDAFWYNGKVLEVGSPRTDVFFKHCNIRLIKESMGLNPETHIILYAPTFRENNDLTAYNLSYEQILKNFIMKNGGTWKIIIRLHPNISYLQKNIKYNENILNGSNFSDINKLIKLCDVLITDYSSCMFDAMFAKKRVLLYVPDVEKYMLDRGLYLKLEDLPFPKSKNMSELLDAIDSFDENDFNNRVSKFLKDIGSFETGCASKKVVEKIIEIIKKN